MNAMQTVTVRAANGLEGVFPEMGHSAPSDVVTDVMGAIDRRSASGHASPQERGDYAVHIEERLIAQMSAARVRHPVRMRSKGR